jgi:hypothetical protein
LVKSNRVLPFDEFALGKVLGAFEHQMLEEMGESGAILRLDAEADVVVDSDHYQRCSGIAGQGDLEAVGEFVIGDGNGEGGLC